MKKPFKASDLLRGAEGWKEAALRGNHDKR